MNLRDWLSGADCERRMEQINAMAVRWLLVITGIMAVMILVVHLIHVL